MKFCEYIKNLDSEYAVHCKTENEARLLLENLDKLQRTWCTGERYSITKWSTYEENTVYYINEGVYGNIEMLDFDKYTVVEFDEILSSYVLEENENIQIKKQLGALIVNHIYNECCRLPFYEEVENILEEFTRLIDSWEVTL